MKKHLRTIIITLTLFLLVVNSISPQDGGANYKVIELYSTLQQLYSEKKYQAVLDNCLEIISIAPNEKRARSIYKQIMIQHHKELAISDKHVELVVELFDDITDFPPLVLLKYYYTRNDTNKIDYLLDRYATIPAGKFTINSDDIINHLNYRINPKYYTDILKTIGRHISSEDSYFLAHSAYIANDVFTFSNIIRSLKIDSISQTQFLSFDKYTNPTLYPIAVKEFSRLLPPQEAFNVLVQGYKFNDSLIIKYLSSLVSSNYYQIIIEKSNLENLMKHYQPDIAIVVFHNLIYHHPMNIMDSLSYIFKYNYLKLAAIVGNEVYKTYLINRLLPELGRTETDLNEVVIWSIVAAINNEVVRARALMNHLVAFGSNTQTEMLKSELIWWYDREYNKENIADLLSELFQHDVKETQFSQMQSLSNIPKEKSSDSYDFDIQYYALLMSVQEYADEDINDLVYPEQDAQSLHDVLTEYYSFSKDNIKMLKNPTRQSIISTIQDLRNQLTENDNLLLFYAGHGIWDEDLQQGYWLPSDAEPYNPANWISNSDIRDYIKAIKTKHTLLIADACFSGGIFKTRDPMIDADKSVQDIYNISSRRAITSGAKKTVPDKSVFIEFLIKRLSENQEKYLETQKLFIQMKDAVINNSPVRQTPMYGIIQETGDEGGGDFIFIKK